MRMEKAYGITLSERALVDAETPRDLLRSIHGAGTSRLLDTFSQAMFLNIGFARGAPHAAPTPVGVLKWHVRAHPEHQHIQLYSDEEESEALTYIQLWDGAAALAAGCLQSEHSSY